MCKHIDKKKTAQIRHYVCIEHFMFAQTTLQNRLSWRGYEYVSVLWLIIKYAAK